MKAILRITVILMVAAIVAGGFYLLANNTNIASGRDLDDRHQSPAMTSIGGKTFHTMESPDKGGEHGASISRGLAGVIGTLVKLTAITLVILLVQKGFSLLGNRKVKTAYS